MKSLCLVFCLALYLTPSFAQTNDKAQEVLCNFACGHIPDLEDSLRIVNQGRHPTLDNHSFTFLTWNIYKGRKKNFPEAFFQITANAHIVAIQEHLDTPVIQSLYADSISPLNYALGISFHMKNGGATGVANLSPWPIESAQLFRTDQLEPFVKTPKSTVATTYKLSSSKKLLVINIHGINFRKAKGLNAQLNQTANLLSQHRGPIIFAGDFNTKTKKRLRETDEFMRQFGLIRIGFKNDSRSQFFKLDHVYYRGLQVEAKALLRGFPGSDHPPIKVVFANKSRT